MCKLHKVHDPLFSSETSFFLPTESFISLSTLQVFGLCLFSAPDGFAQFVLCHLCLDLETFLRMFDSSII